MLSGWEMLPNHLSGRNDLEAGERTLVERFDTDVDGARRVAEAELGAGVLAGGGQKQHRPVGGKTASGLQRLEPVPVRERSDTLT